MKMLLAAVMLAFTPTVVSAQPLIIARDGWEAFGNIQYRGGDASNPRLRRGMLVLSDTTIALYPCQSAACFDTKGGRKPPFKSTPYLTIPLSAIRDVRSSVLSRGPTAGDRFMLGAFAGSSNDEFVAIVYETEQSAEAPIFQTMKHQSAAIDAKLRFRLKKVGLELRSADDKQQP